MPIPRLFAIDEYNHNMNNVDRNDQLSKNYNLDGVSMRDRKWWHPILKAVLKRAVVQAYLMYRKVCELAETARVAPRGDSPSARSRGAAAQKIKPMSHMAFQEKVAGGLIIMAFNELPSTRDDEQLPLDSDPIKALEHMSLAKPSGTAGVSSGSAASRRARPLNLGEPVESRALGEGHMLASYPHDMKKQSAKGDFINPKCSYPHCTLAAENKRTKCGEGQARTQKGRSATGYWCPKCARAFHPTCCNIFHGWQQPEESD